VHGGSKQQARTPSILFTSMMAPVIDAKPRLNVRLNVVLDVAADPAEQNQRPGKLDFNLKVPDLCHCHEFVNPASLGLPAACNIKTPNAGNCKGADAGGAAPSHPHPRPGPAARPQARRRAARGPRRRRRRGPCPAPLPRRCWGRPAPAWSRLSSSPPPPPHDRACVGVETDLCRRAGWASERA
jgi:hypothetical protein